MSVFIDVLRLLAMRKLCIWTIEDVQNADSESAELIHHIAQARIPLVLVLTYQDEDRIPKELRTLLPAATKIQLHPFTEADTAEFVSETLHRDTEYILPLVSNTIRSKSTSDARMLHQPPQTSTVALCVAESFFMLTLASGRCYSGEIPWKHILHQRDTGHLLSQTMRILLLERRKVVLRSGQSI